MSSSPMMIGYLVIFFINLYPHSLTCWWWSAPGCWGFNHIPDQQDVPHPIPCTADNLCCAKARLVNHTQWNSICQGRHIQTRLAHQLHQQANVPEGQMCGRDEWARFQQVLDADYELMVYSLEFFNTVIYNGPQFSEKQICISQTPIFLLLHLCQHSCRGPTSANAAKLVTLTEEPTCVKTAVDAAPIKQNVSLKNGCLARRVTDISSLTAVISTILLQTPVAWYTAARTVGRRFICTVTILVMKRTAGYVRRTNPQSTNATYNHNHQSSKVIDKSIFSMTLNANWMRRRNMFPTYV